MRVICFVLFCSLARAFFLPRPIVTGIQNCTTYTPEVTVSISTKGDHISVIGRLNGEQVTEAFQEKRRG